MEKGILLQDLDSFKDLSWLETYDSNSDGLLEFEEVHKKKLSIPNNFTVFPIKNEASFAAYKKIIYSYNTTQSLSTTFELHGSSIKSLTSPTAENWIASNPSHLTTVKPVRSWKNFKLLDYELSSSYNSLLLKYDDEGEKNDYYFQVLLNENPDDICLQLGKSFYSLNEMSVNAEFEEWRGQLLTGLFVMFIKELDWIPAPYQSRLRDRFEARMLEARPEIYESGYGKRAKIIPDNLKESYEKFQNNEMPMRESPLTVAGVEEMHLKSWYAEHELSPREETKFLEAFQLIPAELTEVLLAQNIFEDLTIQVIEDDIMKLRKNTNPPAYHDIKGGKHFVIFRRSYITDYKAYRIADTLVHELGHVIQGGKEFIYPYYLKQKERLTGTFNPFVSPYFKTWMEFFADAVVAYFNGEVDLQPNTGYYSGPMSRSELREKMPELYLAFRLFFEGGRDGENKYFANNVVFTKRSLKIYESLIENSPDLLDPLTPLDAIITALGLI